VLARLPRPLADGLCRTRRAGPRLRRSDDDIYDAIGGSLVPSSEDEGLVDHEGPQPKAAADGNIDINAAGTDTVTAPNSIDTSSRHKRTGSGGRKGGGRLAWVDTLKVFLTATLVTYQIACVHARIAWGGPTYTLCDLVLHPARCIPSLLHPLQALPFSITAALGTFADLALSHIAPTFFFISGHFVPGSFDKRGIAGFLGAKVKRYGLPYVVFNHVLGPAWLALIQAPSLKTVPASQDYYVPLGGPTWYIAWLLLFCLGYATLATDREDDYRMPCPPIPVFLAAATVNGLYRGYVGESGQNQNRVRGAIS